MANVATGSSPAPTAERHDAALDGVRGLAILVVLIHNTTFILRGSDSFLPKLASALGATGWSGVQLFFVLSGFLITGILLDALGAPAYFRTFYIRRTLRIFPLYYAALTIAFVIVPLVAPQDWVATARANQWWYWTYTSNWSGPFGHYVPGLTHFWSLAVEEQFYLLWPLLVYSLSRRGLIGLCLALLAVTPFIRLLLPAAGLPPQAGYTFTIARWDALAAGAVLAVLLREAPGRIWLERRMPAVAAASLLGLAAVVLIQRGFHEGELPVQVAGQTVIALLSASLIYFSAAPTPGPWQPLRRAVSARWLVFLGKYSYAIYVFHYPIHYVLSRRFHDVVNGADNTARFLRLAAYVSCVAALSIVAALISWRLLERPFLDLKDRLAPRATTAVTS